MHETFLKAKEMGGALWSATNERIDRPVGKEGRGECMQEGGKGGQCLSVETNMLRDKQGASERVVLLSCCSGSE